MVKRIIMPKQKKIPAKETTSMEPVLDPMITEIGRMVVKLCEDMPWKKRPEGWQSLKVKLAERR